MFTASTPALQSLRNSDSGGHSERIRWRATRHRRAIVAVLVLLFVVQTVLTWTTSTAVPTERGGLSQQARRGRQWYQEFNCTACHQFYGLGGYMGPDLTNVTRAKGKGPEYTKAFILHGTARMPNLGVDKSQADDLVAYLDAMAASGTYPIRAANLTPYGTYKEMIPDGE
ncbi:MAG: cytochrome c [Ardenticatenales bacterium]|nr:cytochrome c [Ardenticatenales bacterium]